MKIDDLYPGDPVYVRNEEQKITGIRFQVGTMRWLSVIKEFLLGKGFVTSEEYWDWVRDVVQGIKNCNTEQIMIRFECFAIPNSKLDLSIFVSRAAPPGWYLAWDMKLDLDELIHKIINRYPEIGATLQVRPDSEAGSVSHRMEVDYRMTHRAAPAATSEVPVKIGAGSFARLRLAGIPGDLWSNPQVWGSKGPQRLNEKNLDQFFEVDMPRTMEFARDIRQRLYCPEA